VAVAQAFPLEDAEPDLDPVQPGGMEGNEVHDDALGGGLQPGPTLEAGLQRRVGDAAEVGDGLAEVVVVMGRQVVHDVVDDGIRGQGLHVGGEHPAERVPVMVGGALTVDLAGRRIQEGHQVGDAVATVVEVLEPVLVRRDRQIRRHALEGLDAGAFVEAEEIRRRVEIEVDDVLHLGEEVRVGDLEIVPAAMGSQGMLLEDAMDGGMADRAAEQRGVLREVALGVPQGPGVDPRQRRGVLTIDRDRPQACGFLQATWPTRARQVEEGVAGLAASYPPADGAGMGLRGHGDHALREPFQAQGHDAGPPLDFVPQVRADATGAEGFGEGRQTVLGAQVDSREVFFTAATSSGRVRRMAGRPNWARW